MLWGHVDDIPIYIVMGNAMVSNKNEDFTRTASLHDPLHRSSSQGHNE